MLSLLLRRAMSPPTTELGRGPGTRYFADRIRHPENEPVPGVFIFRSSGGLLYFNTDHVRGRFFELLARRPDPVRTALRLGGFEKNYGPVEADQTVDAVLAKLRNEPPGNTPPASS